VDADGGPGLASATGKARRQLWPRQALGCCAAEADALSAGVCRCLSAGACQLHRVAALFASVQRVSQSPGSCTGRVHRSAVRVECTGQLHRGATTSNAAAQVKCNDVQQTAAPRWRRPSRLLRCIWGALVEAPFRGRVGRRPFQCALLPWPKKASSGLMDTAHTQGHGPHRHCPHTKPRYGLALPGPRPGSMRRSTLTPPGPRAVPGPGPGALGSPLRALKIRLGPAQCIRPKHWPETLARNSLRPVLPPARAPGAYTAARVQARRRPQCEGAARVPRAGA
jgi:hypothetical protein